jgi:hypothetical protein
MPTGQFTAADLTPTSGAPPKQVGQFSAADLDAAPSGNTGAAQPGFLDREIPLDSYKNATLSGVQSIGRGVRGAVQGIWDTIAAPPQDAAEETVGALSPAALPLYRTLRSLGHTAEDATQVVGAIHDINQSADPTGTYAKVAQETAGHGAGQAITALATEGATRLPAWKMVQSAKAIAEPAADAITKLPVIDKVVAAGKMLAKYKAVPGKLSDIWGDPPTYPGAPLPEAPPAEVLQSQPLATGAQPSPASPASALGKIPAPWRMVNRESPPLPDAFQSPIPRPPGTVDNPGPGPTLPTEPAAAPPVDVSKKGVAQAVDNSLGVQPVKAGVPMRYQFKSAPPAEGSVPADNIPEGHTPVEGSSSVRSFKYDADAQEMHIAPKKGYTYVYGDVSPDQAADFQAAKSKGNGWAAIRDSSSPLVAKITEDGKRIAVKPTVTSGEDLTGVLQDSVDAVKKAKWKMKTAQ